MVIRNPVLPGFNPDPSILRVGEEYALATSTFVWQPGIRLYTSRDLTTWQPVGHALVAAGHELRGLDAHAGIWAPDLSHDPASGLFHLAYSSVRSTGSAGFDLDGWRPLGPVLDASFMADEPTRGFTGTMVGLACTDSYRRDLVARFDHLDVRHGTTGTTTGTITGDSEDLP